MQPMIADIVAATRADGQRSADRRHPARHQRHGRPTTRSTEIMHAAGRARPARARSSPSSAHAAGSPPTTTSIHALPAQYPNVTSSTGTALRQPVPGNCCYDDGIHLACSTAQQSYANLIFDAVGLTTGAVDVSRRRCRFRRCDAPAYARRHDLHLFVSPSPVPPARSATACCSASPPGRCSAPTRRDPAAARDHAGARRARGREDGARRLRLPAARRHRRAPTTPTSPSVTPTSPCSSGRCRARRAWSAATCSSANGGIFKPQGKALQRQRQEGRQDPRRRQPGQHQRADRPCRTPRTSIPGGSPR